MGTNVERKAIKEEERDVEGTWGTKVTKRKDYENDMANTDTYLKLLILKMKTAFI